VKDEVLHQRQVGAERLRSAQDVASGIAKGELSRKRKRALTGSCEGRKGSAVVRPEIVAVAKRLRRKNPKSGERRSLRKIAAELAAAGFTNEAGRPFHPQSVKAMVEA